MRKAQVTLFIILGLLVVLFFGVYYYQAVYVDVSEQTKSQEVVQEYVETCLRDIGEQAVQYVARKGGYYQPSEYNVRYVYEGFPLAFDIPYYLYETQNTMPSLEYFADSMNTYIEVMMPYCLENISNATAKQVNIEYSNMKVSTTIGENSVEISMNLPVIIQQQNSQERVESYATSFESSLYKLYLTAEEINTKQKESGDTVCLSCLLEYEKNGIGIALNDFVGDDNLYVLFVKLTEKDSISDTPLILLFAQRFVVETENILQINSIPDQSVTVGYTYTYQVTAEGSNITYSDETDLFDIDSSTGLIQFTPELEDIGQHLIKISVKDMQNNTDAAFFELDVQNVVDAPVLEYISSLVAYVGEEFTYTVSAVDDNNYTIYYYDDSELFNVDSSSGLISYTPQTADKGEHTFTISAVNEMGGVDEQQVTMIII
jgi:hypothetical protein